MTNEEEQAMIEWCNQRVGALNNYCRANPDDREALLDLNLCKIALAALTAQPVKLPDNVPCKGAPQFVWLQVNCDTGNPSEWPEHPGAGVTWHTEQVHSDDVLYIRVNNDEVPE